MTDAEDTRARAIAGERRGAARGLSTRGRAAGSVVLGALVACAVLVAAVMVALRDDGPSDGAGRATHGSAPRGGTPDPALERPVAEPTRAETGPKRPLDLDDPANFSGRGAIRGEFLARPGAQFPSQWTLVVEPSVALKGRERATLRRVEFELGERTFEVLDLPLAGYRVRAEAQGLNATPAEVLLVASSPVAFVTLAFTPAGLVDGIVRQADGSPAEGLSVTIENTSTRARSVVETDVNGAWIARNVVDGEYRIYLGPPAAPLVPPRTIEFRAPSLRAPEERLPPLGALEIVVLDSTQARVPETVLTGASKRGGAFEARTDASGRALVRFLVPGRWNIEARHGARESGSVTVDVTENATSDVSIHVHD